jgi:hypothetical protein
MVMNVFEGYSGWLVVLEEAVALAVALNRVLVLSCFRAGKLRPCTPWAPIRGPPVLTTQAASADATPAGSFAAWQALAREGAAGLPAFAMDCAGNGSELLPPSSRSGLDAFSLDAYFSRAGIDSIVARGLARLPHVRGVPLPRRPRGYYRAHTTSFGEWLSATYPGRRITRPLHFNVAAVDLMTNQGCQWEATTNKYFAGEDYVFMGGKLCPAPPHPGDNTVSGLGHDLGFLAEPRWQMQPLVVVVKWQRSQMLDMQAAVPFPQPHANHFALVRAWLRRHRLSTASLARLASSTALVAATGGAAVAAASGAAAATPAAHPGDGDCGATGDGTGSSVAVVQWRTETLGASRFAKCTRLVVGAVRALTRAPAVGGGGGSCSSSNATTHSRGSGSGGGGVARHTQPVVLVTDLPTAGNPCAASFNYAHDKAQSRSASPLLSEPGVLKYDRSLLEAGVPLFDAGVMSLHEYLLALAASDYHSCNTRGKSLQHRLAHLQCHKCFWASEFIARIVHAREALGLPGTDDTFLDAPPRPAPRG